jgi:probable phosphomutase (TIGR03848 family)
VTTFFLVRHGVTSHTGYRLSGRLPDIHLTDEGVQQAEAVAERLSNVRLKAVYSSPIERTVETARPIAARQGLRVQVRRGLNEMEFGRWTNRSFKTLRSTKLWPTIQHWPSGARFPDGETVFEVQQRAVKEIETIRSRHPRQQVCCVSHADVLKLITAHYLGTHIDLYQRIGISPGSVTVIAIGDTGPHVLAVNITPNLLTEKR